MNKLKMSKGNEMKRRMKKRERKNSFQTQINNSTDCFRIPFHRSIFVVECSSSFDSLFNFLSFPFSFSYSFLYFYFLLFFFILFLSLFDSFSYHSQPLTENFLFRCFFYFSVFYLIFFIFH